MKAKQCSNVFNMLREYNCQPRLHVNQVIFKKEGKVMTFLRNKTNSSLSIDPLLKEPLKDVIHKEGK
jgi:uncharacterized OB-fold protein